MTALINSEVLIYFPCFTFEQGINALIVHLALLQFPKDFSRMK